MNEYKSMSQVSSIITLIGTIMQIASALQFIVCMFGVAFINKDTQNPWGIILGFVCVVVMALLSFVSGVFTKAMGEALIALRDIAINTRHS